METTTRFLTVNSFLELLPAFKKGKFLWQFIGNFASLGIPSCVGAISSNTYATQTSDFDSHSLYKRFGHSLEKQIRNLICLRTAQPISFSQQLNQFAPVHYAPVFPRHIEQIQKLGQKVKTIR